MEKNDFVVLEKISSEISNLLFDKQCEIEHQIEDIENKILVKKHLVDDYKQNFDNEEFVFSAICDLLHKIESLENKKEKLVNKLKKVSEEYKKSLNEKK